MIFQYQIFCHFSEDFFILTFMYPYFYLRIQDHLILATGSGGWSSNGCGASDHLKVVLNDAAERPERCPRAAVRHDEVKGRRNKPTGATVISNYRNTKRCVLFLSCWWDRWTGHLSSRRYIYGYMKACIRHFDPVFLKYG